jgi:hypothetical protein
MFVLAFAGAAAGQTATQMTALSAWTNQSGSTLYIDAVDPTGKVTGHYINRAAGYGCQNIAYPVTGWIYGSAITFTVKWQSSTESCNSITAWTGFLYNGKISTLWQLVINGSTSTTQILQGSDVFSPSAVMSHPSLVKPK